jgi:hypothetical protein
MNSKNKNIRHCYREINEFKRGYLPRSNLVKDENGDLLTDSNTILDGWKSYFISYRMYVLAVMLGREKYSYIQLTH